MPVLLNVADSAGEAQVGAQGEAHAAAVGRAVHGGDHRLAASAGAAAPAGSSARIARWAIRPTCRPSMFGHDAVVLQVEPGARTPGPSR